MGHVRNDAHEFLQALFDTFPFSFEGFNAGLEFPHFSTFGFRFVLLPGLEQRANLGTDPVERSSALFDFRNQPPARGVEFGEAVKREIGAAVEQGATNEVEVLADEIKGKHGCEMGCGKKTGFTGRKYGFRPSGHRPEAVPA